MNRIIEDAIKLTANWYDWVRRGTRGSVPAIGSPDFWRFMGQSNAFSYELNPSEGRITINLTDKTDTAFVELRTKAISISSKLANRDFYVKMFGEMSDYEVSRLALGNVNGTVVHEALHIKYTNTHFANDLRGDWQFAKLGEYVTPEQIFTTFNILEDIFIEARAPRHLAMWLQITEDILIPAERANIDADSKISLDEALNLAISYKNPRARVNPSFRKFLPVRCMKILEDLVENEHLPIFGRIQYTFEFLKELLNSDKILPLEQRDTSGDGSFSKDYRRATTEDQQALGEALDALLETDDLSEDELEEAAESVSASSREIVSDKVYSGDSKFFVTWNEPIIADLEDDFLERCFDDRVSITPVESNDYRFVRDLVASRTVNRSPGQARNRGPVMVSQRLTRIATDGKVFAKRDSQNRRAKRAEVIILVDFSGSTMGSVVNEEMGAFLMISNALTEAGIPNVVYFHTSLAVGRYGPLTVESDTPLLVHVASYDMLETTPNRNRRFDRTKYYCELAQNYDGVIIDEVSKRFTGSEAERYIIVLSDGEPANGRSYSGAGAIAHTKEVIQQVRKIGTHVFSISVVGSVVAANNGIYGREYNIDGSGMNVHQEFKKLINKIMSV